MCVRYSRVVRLANLWRNMSKDIKTEELSKSVDQEPVLVTPPSTPQAMLDEYLSQGEDVIRPWEQVMLPSKGVYYKGKIPGGYVEVRPWGLKAEKIMTTQRLVRTGEALDYIFQYHVRLPEGFDDHLDLLADDRVFLLYYLRGISHGPEYEFMIKCPECKEMGEHEYDMRELWETVTYPDLDIGDEPFRLVLPIATEQLQKKHPDSEFWIKLRFLRGQDTVDFLNSRPKGKGGKARARNRSKKTRQQVLDEVKKHGETLDETLEKNINRVIVEVMGVTNRDKVRQFVETLHSHDIAVIMDFLKENSPGIDTSIETECPHPKCGVTFIVGLPITETFFRPKRSRSFRK